MATIHDGPHKYIKVRIGKFKKPWFKCSIAGCVHHIRPELAEGRRTICNRCGEDMVLTKLNMQLARPHCDDCTKRKAKPTEDKIAELIKKMKI